MPVFVLRKHKLFDSLCSCWAIVSFLISPSAPADECFYGIKKNKLFVAHLTLLKHWTTRVHTNTLSIPLVCLITCTHSYTSHYPGLVFTLHCVYNRYSKFLCIVHQLLEKTRIKRLRSVPKSFNFSVCSRWHMHDLSVNMPNTFFPLYVV